MTILARMFLSLIFVAVVLGEHVSLAADCLLPQSFEQVNLNVTAKTTPVWGDADHSVLFFESGLHTNTDGAKRSYSVDDFWGEQTALNNLCNAMNDKCAGLDKSGMRARRITTQKAMANGWRAPDIAATKISRSIIGFTRGGKPCPQTDGFLVSATALSLNTGKDCDRAAFIDAVEIPALVIPGPPAKGVKSGFAKAGAGVGDLVVAIGPSRIPIFGIIGDTGPGRQLGEASIAMNGRLLGKAGEPKNYQEIRGRGEFKGKGWDVGHAEILIFPNSRKTPTPYVNRAEIDTAAQDRFRKWGGLEHLRDCAAAYDSAVDPRGQVPAP